MNFFALLEMGTDERLENDGSRYVPLCADKKHSEGTFLNNLIPVTAFLRTMSRVIELVFVMSVVRRIMRVKIMRSFSHLSCQSLRVRVEKWIPNS
jgi:hypothetical protein